MNWMPPSNLASAGGTRSTDDTVIGVCGTPYSCPDVSAVDHHIVRLYNRIEHAVPWLPEFVELLWADIDLLLDHRMWLGLTRTLTETDCLRPAPGATETSPSAGLLEQSQQAAGPDPEQG